jgi:hypothetical protein
MDAVVAREFTARVVEDETQLPSGLVTLMIPWTDGEQSAGWANVLVERVSRERGPRARPRLRCTF